MQAKKDRIKRSSNPFVLAAMAELAAHGGVSAKRASLAGSAKGLNWDNGSDGADVSSDDDDSGDDLDNFIVCKPGRNYHALFARQFKYSCTEPKSLLRKCV